MTLSRDHSNTTDYGAENGITVGGTSNNVLAIQHDATKNGTPGHYRIFLWNVTDRIVIMRGDIDIEPSVFDVP